jgi:hypothetical protein
MPRIKTTRTVKFALWALRVYLLILLTLIGIKFARVWASSKKTAQTVSASAAVTVDTRPPGAELKQ